MLRAGQGRGRRGIVYTAVVNNNPSPVFAPHTLFAGSEVGAFYDFKDVSTVSQSSQGISTSPGGATLPVGQVLDKSKWQGLTYSDVMAQSLQLFTNPGFDDGLTDWTMVNGATATGSASGGVVSLPRVSGTDMATLRRSVAVTANAGYLYEFKVTYATGNTLSTRMKAGTAAASNAYGQVDATTGSVYLQARATGATLWADVLALGTGTSLVESASLKSFPSYPARQTTTTARPTYNANGSLTFDGVDDALTVAFPSAMTGTVAYVLTDGSTTFLTAQSIGTTYTLPAVTGMVACVIINRSLTNQETSDLATWFAARAAT